VGFIVGPGTSELPLREASKRAPLPARERLKNCIKGERCSTG
jgi:hypothetical protein